MNFDTNKIIAKKKEELDGANEKRIKELQQIAKLSESEAKESVSDDIYSFKESKDDIKNKK